MNANPQAAPAVLDDLKPITIAVVAMGGQGGGVLVDWIVALAESAGWFAQSTSVPGVAQRTGATIYYVEMIPLPDGLDDRRRPVLSLMPVQGDVDLVIAAELMEAGRAIQRGIVSPDKTVLIASSHRAFAVAEKMVPGDGASNSSAVYDAALAASKKFIAFDMAAMAEKSGSVISAVLFGAVAGSGALPFGRDAYEATIRAAGVGVDASLRAFALGLAKANEERVAVTPPAPPRSPQELKLYPGLKPTGHPGYDALVARIGEKFPREVHGMLAAGLMKVVDFQDVHYGGEYLDLVEPLFQFDRAAQGGAKGWQLTLSAAKHVAVAMAYDDVIRVADLKTRASRFERVRKEVLAKPEQLVYTTEFMHPRMEEVCGTLPARWGKAIEARPGLFKWLDGLVNRGRRVRTGTLLWFLPLYFVGGLRKWRRGTLRHEREIAHRDDWLAQVRAVAPRDYALAVELLETRRLVKGYSDTHARGQSKFDRVMRAAAGLQGRPDAADWVRRLRQAALLDEEGKALNDAMKTVESFL